jgi:hypothetical protein
MKIQRLAAVATAAALLVTGLVVAGPAQAAPAKPGVVVDYAYHKVKVKPKTIIPFKDVYYSKVRWTSLSSTTGYATATRNVNTCKPDCAASNYKRTTVKLKFTKVKLSDCRRVFSRVKETETRSKRTVTRKLPVFARSGC